MSRLTVFEKDYLNKKDFDRTDSSHPAQKYYVNSTRLSFSDNECESREKLKLKRFLKVKNFDLWLK